MTYGAASSDCREVQLLTELRRVEHDDKPSKNHAGCRCACVEIPCGSHVPSDRPRASRWARLVHGSVVACALGGYAWFLIAVHART